MKTRRFLAVQVMKCHFLVLCLLLVVGDSVLAQQSRDSKQLKLRLERLAASKAEYAKVQEAAKSGVVNRFDEVIGLVEGSRGIPADLRIQLRQELTTARDRFQDDSEYTPILAFQETYEKFAEKSLNSYGGLMADYERALRLLPSDDSRREKLEKEIETYSGEFAKFDSLKVGTTFVGYRSDFDWGPVTKVVQAGNAVRLQRVPNPPVNVDFTLRIDKRIGQLLEGTITQAGGQFEAIVEGTYDGVNLNFKMVRMKRGAPRYFEYSGQLVGVLGRVHLRGIKVNGVKTTGVLTLQRQ